MNMIKRLFQRLYEMVRPRAKEGNVEEKREQDAAAQQAQRHEYNKALELERNQKSIEMAIKNTKRSKIDIFVEGGESISHLIYEMKEGLIGCNFVIKNTQSVYNPTLEEIAQEIKQEKDTYGEDVFSKIFLWRMEHYILYSSDINREKNNRMLDVAKLYLKNGVNPMCLVPSLHGRSNGEEKTVTIFERCLEKVFNCSVADRGWPSFSRDLIKEMVFSPKFNVKAIKKEPSSIFALLCEIDNHIGSISYSSYRGRVKEEKRRQIQGIGKILIQAGLGQDQFEKEGQRIISYHGMKGEKVDSYVLNLCNENARV